MHKTCNSLPERSLNFNKVLFQGQYKRVLVSLAEGCQKNKTLEELELEAILYQQFSR